MNLDKEETVRHTWKLARFVSNKVRNFVWQLLVKCCGNCAPNNQEYSNQQIYQRFCAVNIKSRSELNMKQLICGSPIMQNNSNANFFESRKKDGSSKEGWVSRKSLPGRLWKRRMMIITENTMNTQQRGKRVKKNRCKERTMRQDLRRTGRCRQYMAKENELSVDYVPIILMMTYQKWRYLATNTNTAS